MDHPDNVISPSADASGTLSIDGGTRVYLVQNHSAGQWEHMKYVRVDLRQPGGLRFKIDLSRVPCGALTLAAHTLCLATPHRRSCRARLSASAAHATRLSPALPAH